MSGFKDEIQLKSHIKITITNIEAKLLCLADKIILVLLKRFDTVRFD